MRYALAGDPAFDYQVERHNSDWPDHALRAMVTAGMIAWLRPKTVCDPACGDASLLEAAHKLHPIQMAYLGDISRPSIESLQVSFPHRLSVQDAALTLQGTPQVDLVLLTEFLEHIPDPDEMLRLARTTGDWLIASSPHGERTYNPEHLWGWDADGYQQMLIEAGWDTIVGGGLLGWGIHQFQIYIVR
jgi:hypothetical protein